jgi:hypothetical protein
MTIYSGTENNRREAMFSDTRAFIGVPAWLALVWYVEDAAWQHAKHILGGGKRSLNFDKIVVSMVINSLSMAGVEGAPAEEVCRVYLAAVGEGVREESKVRPAILKGQECEEALALVNEGKHPTHNNTQQHFI